MAKNYFYYTDESGVPKKITKFYYTKDDGTPVKIGKAYYTGDDGIPKLVYESIHIHDWQFMSYVQSGTNADPQHYPEYRCSKCNELYGGTYESCTFNEENISYAYDSNDIHNLSNYCTICGQFIYKPESCNYELNNASYTYIGDNTHVMSNTCTKCGHSTSDQQNCTPGSYSYMAGGDFHYIYCKYCHEQLGSEDCDLTFTPDMGGLLGSQYMHTHSSNGCTKCGGGAIIGESCFYDSSGTCVRCGANQWQDCTHNSLSYISDGSSTHHSVCNICGQTVSVADYHQFNGYGQCELCGYKTNSGNTGCC